MKLTVLSDYSLRMLMHLAVNSGRLVTISDTANRFNISKNHLMKVAHQLGQMGFIETVRGRSGGLRLAKAPASIVLGDVVRKMEQSTNLVECFPGGKGECRITQDCRLRAILYEAQNAFFLSLDRFTLADLTDQNLGLKSLLFEEVTS